MTKIALAALFAAAVFTRYAALGVNAAPSGDARAGEKIFATNCTGCHGANALGVPGLFPPLVKNPYVAGDAKRVIHTVKYGLTGKIVVKGKTYDGTMPAWEGTLSESQIADVVTYIRTSLRNNASAVTTAQVGAVKK